jgi:hypothetical protein
VKTYKQKILPRLNEPISNTELERETQKVQIMEILRKKYTDKNVSFIIIFFCDPLENISFRVEGLFVLRPVGDLNCASVVNLWAQHKNTHFYSFRKLQLDWF